MATYMYNRDGVAKARCNPAPVYVGAQWVDTTWDDALAIYCGVAKKMLDKDGPSGSCSTASTTAAPAAGLRTPGAPAS